MENYGKGLITQMQESTPIKYEELTVELLEETLESLFNRPTKPQRVMTMFTGRQGMLNFDWNLTYGDTINCRHFKTKFKYGTGSYISLFKKGGKYKLRITGSTFKFYKGTRLIKTFLDIRSEHFLEMKQDHMQTVTNMKKINNYINTLRDE